MLARLEPAASLAQPASQPAIQLAQPADPLLMQPLGQPLRWTADEELGFGDILRGAPSWLISSVVHLLLMVLLALWNAEPEQIRGDLGVIATQFHSRSAAEDLLPPETNILTSRLDEAAKDSDNLVSRDADKLLVPAGALVGSPNDVAAIAAGPQPTLLGGAFGADSLLSGNSLETRLDGDLRRRLLFEGGGTLESEAAVERALLWLSRHQNSDGSWNFNLKMCAKCRGRCADSGSLSEARIAATGLALLPFLGKGQTHKSGEYRQTIHAGLYYLMRSMHTDNNTSGSLHQGGGRMYGHGLASIALCEAYGMTRDKMLKGPAQAAVNYIVAAQDPDGGGWRYEFQQPGDTSVVGWQLMALKSAQMAYLNVPQETIRKTEYFLDFVQSNGGAEYGYTSSGTGAATNAIGLLCRLYLGNPSKQEAVARGAQLLGEWGPALEQSGPRINDLYYNYYATQVLHHIGGQQWKAWNQPMRSYLIEKQVLDQSRHDYGSWNFSGNDHGHRNGGRLYCTAMSAMILEVYYRHMPLYRQKPGKGFFN